MAKLNAAELAKLTIVELVGIATKDATMMEDVSAEIERRNANPVPQASGGVALVDFNSGGGLMIQEGSKTTVSSSGSLYAGSANMPLTIARLILGDSAESVDIRKRAMALLSLPADQIQSRVAEKKAKKDDNAANELAKTRKAIERAVKSGLMPASALAEFDATNAAK